MIKDTINRILKERNNLDDSDLSKELYRLVDITQKEMMTRFNKHKDILLFELSGEIK